MPRKPRFVVPGVAMHVVQRGRNREPVFFEAEDHAAWLDWFGQGTRRYGCAVHAYVLMTNHLHVLMTPSDSESVMRTMQYVGRHYVPYVNRKYGLSGSLWEGRYKASLVGEEDYLLACMRYIELNPVRAGICRSPSQYRWSSYRANAQGKADDLVEVHPIYRSLARTWSGRQQNYKSLFSQVLEQHELDRIQSAWLTGTPLGNDRFRRKIESRLGQKTGQARRGRPDGWRKRSAP